MSKLDPEDRFQIRRSGIFASLSTLIQLVVLLSFFIIPYFALLFYPFLVYYSYIFLVTAICAGILQIIVLLTGMKRLIPQFGPGKSFLWLSVIALIIATSCIPLSLLFFDNSPTWFILGMIIPPYSFSSDLAYLLWFTVIKVALTVYSFTFGYILIKNDKIYQYGDLKTPGAFLLIQGSLQAATTVLLNVNLSSGYPLSSIKSMLMGFGLFIYCFVTVIWFLYLGYQLRKIPNEGFYDGWDRFRQEIRENPSIQSFLAHKMFGIIAMIASAICMGGIIINSLLHLLPTGYFWWLSLTGLLLGFLSLKFEGANGYAIAALGMGSLCWLAGAMISSWSYYFI